MKFESYALKPSLLESLNKQNIVEPTEIQAKAIPVLLEDPTDFVGQAQTGTGKTAAFALPLLTNLDTSVKTPQVLVLHRFANRESSGEFESLDEYDCCVDLLGKLRFWSHAEHGNE